MRVHHSVLRLSVGHFFVDQYSSMLGAFLPFLHEQLNLSLTQAGLLGGTLILSGSFLQPLYGYLSDRLQNRAFTVFGPAVAGIFISSLGSAPSFEVLLLLVFLGGIGIASFHPQGTAVAFQASPRAAGFHLSFFITSGMIGYSLGPIFITYLIATVGLKNTYWAALPGIAVTLYLLARGPAPARAERNVRRSLMIEQMRRQRRPLIIHFLLVVVRSAVQLTFVSFLPLYLLTQGFSAYEGSQMLALFLLAAGLAGFLGGVLTDRIGGKAVIIFSLLAGAPMLVGFLLTDGWFSLLLCVLGGGMLFLTLPVNVVMAQELVPEGASTISALMMGFAWGIGGIAVPLVGVSSDRMGLQNTLLILVLLCLPSILLAIALPGSARPEEAVPIPAPELAEAGETQ